MTDTHGFRAVGRLIRRQALAAGDEDLLALSERFLFSDIRSPGQLQLASGTSGFTIGVSIGTEIKLLDVVFDLLGEALDQKMKVALTAKISLSQSVDWHSVLALTTLPPELHRTHRRRRESVELSWLTPQPILLGALAGLATTTELTSELSIDAEIPLLFFDGAAKAGMSLTGKLERAWRYRLVDPEPRAFGLDDRAALASSVDEVLNGNLKASVAHWLIVNGEIPRGQSNAFTKLAAEGIAYFETGIAKKTGGRPVDEIPELKHSTAGLLGDLARLRERLERERHERPAVTDQDTEARELARIDRRLAELDLWKDALTTAKSAKDRADDAENIELSRIVPPGHCFVEIRTFVAKVEAKAGTERTYSFVEGGPNLDGLLGDDDGGDDEETEQEPGEEGEEEEQDDPEDLKGIVEIDDAPSDSDVKVSYTEGTITRGASVSSELSARTSTSRVQWTSEPAGSRRRRLVTTTDTEVVNLVIPFEGRDGLGGLSYRSATAVWLTDDDTAFPATTRLVPGHSGIATGVAATVDELVRCVAHPTGRTATALSEKLEMHSPHLLSRFFAELRKSDFDGETGSYVRAVAGAALDSTETMLVVEVHAGFGSNPATEVTINPADGTKPPGPADLIDMFFGSGPAGHRGSRIQSIRLRGRLEDTDNLRLGGSIKLGNLGPLSAKLTLDVHSSVQCLRTFEAGTVVFRGGHRVRNPKVIDRMPLMTPVPLVVA